MLFNSPEFIFLFLPTALIVFFQLGKQGYRQVAIAWLVAVSFFFYGWWELSYIKLLLGSIFFNYWTGIALSRHYKIKYLNRKFLLTIGIIFNLALLGYFKYANFFALSLNNVFGTSFNLQTIVLPLAISFFTFNQVAYLVDAYRGDAEEYNFLKYCLFISFFPHLIAGPIVHHKEMIPQFNQNSIFRFNAEDMAVGLTIFLLGISKKVFFADCIALPANQVFDAASQGISPTFSEAWIGALAYSLQLYFDFSGYSDMAIGAARMFGIKFPLNFNSPYKAKDIIEFWRRWHMTLSRFLRDYLYIPLGGNRKGKLRRYLNLMITMLLGGLWHGAGWTYVFWGGLHGVYLIINHQWNSILQKLGHNSSKSKWWIQGLCCLITFLAVVIAWVFFRAENMATASIIIKSMIGANGLSFSPSIYITNTKVVILILLILVAWLTPNTQQWMSQYNPAIEVVKNSFPNNHLWKKLQWQPTIVLGIFIGLLGFLTTKTLLSAPTSEFLYFNF
ncbi:MAG: MBOAT family protein [Chroococcidiopsidaceae cyanobacterium CP_BM_ER_R8_30]|nr:MBOAT family protein [Chroococcidiopsidaceae cyanobacterium CP_BM_ER_R8_30]